MSDVEGHRVVSKIGFSSLISTLVFLLISGVSAQQQTGSTGGGAAHENAQPYLGLSPLIRLSGSSAGEIRYFAGAFEPTGWAFADGRFMDLNDPTNADLFGVIGTTYGAQPDMFALPDLRGRTGAHVGTGTGLSTRSLGEAFGARTVSLGENNLPGHTHTLSGGNTFPTGGGVAHENTSPSLGLNFGVVTTGGLNVLGRVGVTAGSTLPAGQMAADGTLLDKTTFSALHSVVGDVYGSTATEFALPDLRSRGALGKGQGGGLSSRQRGDSFGLEAISLTEGQIPSHSHTLPGGGDSGSTGGGGSHGNMGPSLTMTYAISETGTVPISGAPGDIDGDFFGQVSLFSGSAAPAGWLEANGDLLNIVDHTALFSLFGTIYGGDGLNTFGLPDLRGRVPVGFGTGPGLQAITLGESGGVEEVTLGVSELAAHTHTVPEPSGGLLAILGGILLAAARRRR